MSAQDMMDDELVQYLTFGMLIALEPDADVVIGMGRSWNESWKRAFNVGLAS